VESPSLPTEAGFTRTVPGTLVYHVGLDDGTVVLVAEHDLCGPLLDLVTAVLAIGDALLTRSPEILQASHTHLTDWRTAPD
jgi:hypothetical protein